MIELLVVISVVAMLIALLLPALARARKQARAVVCQSRLRQLGLLGAVYAHEDGATERYRVSDGSVREGLGLWRVFFLSRLNTAPELRLCPSATRPLPGNPVPWGGTFHCYTRGAIAPAAPEMNHITGYGSYGVNTWTGPLAVDQSEFRGWRCSDIKGASSIPVFFDCAMDEAGLLALAPPPEVEYAASECSCSYPTHVSRICMNRHHEGINMAFMDWSVRKVGLKELWTLRWHPKFDTAGPWTKAGGALPEDWPAWMRKFKDY